MADSNDYREPQAETTSVFRADLLKEMENGSEAPEQDLGQDLPAGAGLVVVKRGPNAGARFLLDRDVTLAGRNPEADIFLDDVTVSRRHVEFRRTGSGGFEVVDLGSLNGTYVNREPRNASALSSGDEIQIGKFRLVFVAGPGEK
ncbi:oxoglutarate dehydrogenase inhibitor Odhl [Corynebacterium otitidis]|uniref:Oxoglutarate dehydrogenase inhibitor n=1 Tax=Corynebacterium otitidis ATCC 51513 TaxID=883169 RepID=I7KJH0_9CORY|nr:FHA domain-containing protein [Corynebacterium otitidis]EJZ82382.1 oxoglutarate dehydrogenase inhibitor [Corynebacterium otitidis ATCC 51513]KKO83021.1 oxoglutarate dehydrogenase inhibitor [Corynebacterium otitidis]CCI83610.1 Oxoglutarate dehydrogenase inhibitor [Corynebacterium otitidis ATCC 51513]